MATKRGLYVHIPLCVRKCAYCDFCSYPEKTATWRKDYIDALLFEMEGYADKKIEIDTVYFGGGTPSLLSSEELSKIVEKAHECFIISENTEFTLEANPKTLSKEKVTSFVKAGVNRISLGLQSIHENEQKILGRIHNFKDFLSSYELVRTCGIDNVNVDLMYAVPEQTLESFAASLQKLISLKPEHISLYGLILEEGTPFFDRRNSLLLADEDTEYEMYNLALQMLSRAGYSHYEISNYARAGRESRHNLKYWRAEEYVGIGVSAHSYIDGVRYGNTRDIHEYLASRSTAEWTEESKEEMAYDYAMLGLRLSEGISLSEYRTRFGVDFLTGRKDEIERFIKEGLMRLSGDRISITEKGFYVSNSILTALL